MIQEIITKGSMYTTFHNIQISSKENRLEFSAGQAWQKNEVVLEIKEPVTIDIPINENECYYEVNLTKEKIIINAKTKDQTLPLTHAFMKLCWFTVPANTTSLDEVEIYFVKVVEENGD